MCVRDKGDYTGTLYFLHNFLKPKNALKKSIFLKRNKNLGIY